MYPRNNTQINDYSLHTVHWYLTMKILRRVHSYLYLESSAHVLNNDKYYVGYTRTYISHSVHIYLTMQILRRVHLYLTCTKQWQVLRLVHSYLYLQCICTHPYSVDYYGLGCSRIWGNWRAGFWVALEQICRRLAADFDSSTSWRRTNNSRKGTKGW